MWLATKHGFYSVVYKEGFFHIRARSDKDLVNLRDKIPELPEITYTPRADYCARICTQDRELIGKVMAMFVEGLNYGNFKDTISSSMDQADKVHAYMSIWGVMYEYQNMGDYEDYDKWVS